MTDATHKYMLRVDGHDIREVVYAAVPKDIRREEYWIAKSMGIGYKGVRLVPLDGAAVRNGAKEPAGPEAR